MDLNYSSITHIHTHRDLSGPGDVGPWVDICGTSYETAWLTDEDRDVTAQTRW